MSAIRVVITSPIRLRCYHCNRFELPDIEEGVKAYFFGDGHICGNCRGQIDWWETVQHVLRSTFNNLLFGMIGAKVSGFNFRLRPQEVVELNLDHSGVPKSAKVLHISYHPHNHGLKPIVIGTNPTSRYNHAKQLTIYGLPQGGPLDGTMVHASVTWIDHVHEEHSLKNMILAFDLFHHLQFEQAIIPAQVAIEPPLYMLVEKVFQQYAGKKRTRDFLEQAATYSHQLNVLLPLICATNSFPKLPTPIRDHLNTLRGYRNSLAHKGMIKSELQRKEMAELLAASLFTVSFIRLLNEHLDTKINEQAEHGGSPH